MCKKRIGTGWIKHNWILLGGYSRRRRRTGNRTTSQCPDMVKSHNSDINSWKLKSTLCPIGFLQQLLCLFIETLNMKHSVIWVRKWVSTPWGCCPKRRVYQSLASHRLCDNKVWILQTLLSCSVLAKPWKPKTFPETFSCCSGNCNAIIFLE